ncbi:MAG: nucleotide exchange factor GrpE [Chloroflexi bacterium]|nr:nucleotide exchange factor GrpE [Chloroflexota bacterium]
MLEDKENDEKLDCVNSENISNDDVIGESENQKTELDKSAEDIQAELLKEAEHYKSIAQRAQADLINYRSRAAQELEETRRTIKFGILGRFLSVVDDLARAVENVPDEVNDDWEKGVSLVLRNLENALEMEGVTKIESLGLQFDPHLHDALMFEETEEKEEGLVTSVIQEGYKINDRILRPARVVVSKAPAEQTQNDKEEGE